MANPELKLDDKGRGAFIITENGEKIAEMVVAIDEENLFVYHTEVSPQAEGKGLAKLLLETMVQHARKHQIKVVPLCPYVHAQFNRHKELYADLWDGDPEV